MSDTATGSTTPTAEPRRGLRLGQGTRVALILIEVALLLAASVALYHVFGRDREASSEVAAVIAGSGAVVDGFGGAAGPLARTDTGERWRTEGGTWRVEGGEAIAPETVPVAGTVALVRLGGTDAAVRARVGTGSRGWSLVARWDGEGTYWRVESVPSAGGYRLVHVVAGTPRTMGTTGLAPVSRGTVVELVVSGTRVAVAIDGRLRMSARDPGAGKDASADRVGMMVAPDGIGGAAWEGFRASTAANITWPPPRPGTGAG